MSLRSWLDSHWLVEHTTSAREVADLLEVVDRDLADASIDGLSADWRMGIAYNAALQLATLALAAAGYRPGRDRAHERAIQSLRYTIALDQPTIDTLDGVRRKRNISHYERAGTTSHGEAAEVHEIASHLRTAIRSWLEREHPELLHDR
ncbi:MAG: hypothetical protein MUC69_03365 [Gemmatimonadales bacterium]|jgi:hypothetical protein|nr:hypothetical protein [Gemmatimonadales bacterium]